MSRIAKVALLALERCVANLHGVKAVLADGSYAGKPFAQAVESLLGAQIQIARRIELHTFAVISQRWVVERSFAWLEKCRRLWKNGERLHGPRIVERLSDHAWRRVESRRYDRPYRRPGITSRCRRLSVGRRQTAYTGAPVPRSDP